MAANSQNIIVIDSSPSIQQLLPSDHGLIDESLKIGGARASLKKTTLTDF
jgi:hypothetical protein